MLKTVSIEKAEAAFAELEMALAAFPQPAHAEAVSRVVARVKRAEHQVRLLTPALRDALDVIKTLDEDFGLAITERARYTRALATLKEALEGPSAT